MPDRSAMNALDALSSKVRHAMTRALHDASWGKPQLMSRALEEVSAVFDTPCEPVSRSSLEHAMDAFRRTRCLPTFLDLKYACLGVAQSFGDSGWRLMDDPFLFPALLERVEDMLGAAPEAGARGSRRFLKCYQALLSGYFAYNIRLEYATDQGRKNWTTLRSYLSDRLPAALLITPTPRWVEVLSRNAHLLSGNIFGHYAEALGQGAFHELKSACETLLIPRSSWVWEVTVLLRVKALCDLDDDGFKGRLDQCLALVTRAPGITFSAIMKKQCIALLAARYGACASRPEHAGLLDASVEHIGNPWVCQAAWDAFVKSEPARAMTTSWLKRRLIRDFFGILSEGTPADGSRLRSWLKVEQKIDDVWIALGQAAFTHSGARHRELRALAGERILEIEYGDRPDTNALIMRIDDYVFVELSQSGHTCMVFKSSALPFDLDKKWVYVGTQAPSQQQLFLQGQVLRQNIISAGTRGSGHKPS